VTKSRLALATGAGAFLVTAAYHGLAVDDSDTPWHVADGKLILRRLGHGTLGPVRTDPFSWTARGRPWHPNAWAFDALTALTYKAGRWTGVSVFRLVLLAGLIAAAWAFTARLATSGWARGLALLLAASFLAPFAVLRPQLASYLLLPVALVLAGRIFDGRRPAVSLLLLGVVVSLWADLHGVVVAGVLAVAAASAGHVLEARARGALMRAALAAGVALVASCTSPYGWSVWTYATRTRAASRNILEWQHPSWHASGDVTLFGAIAIAGLWALWRRPVPWRDVLPAVAMAVLALDAVRNEPLAVLASLPLFAGAIEQAGQVLRARTPPWFLDSPTPRARTLSPLAAYAGVVAAALAIELFIDHGSAGLDPSRLRAGAFPAVSAAALPPGCRLLNEYADGGYLILARPDVPVSEDGRNDLYGAAFVDAQIRLLAGGDGTPKLDREGITCVLLAPGRGLIPELVASGEWVKVAADRRAQAWVRRGAS
jgi:hypothetical protein